MFNVHILNLFFHHPSILVYIYKSDTVEMVDIKNYNNLEMVHNRYYNNLEVIVSYGMMFDVKNIGFGIGFQWIAGKEKIYK